MLRDQILSKWIELYLQALRQREQEIVRFIAILTPALGGFFLILANRHKEGIHGAVFNAGIVGVDVLLALGAWYTIALGYNYRSILLQLVKVTRAAGVIDVKLQKWPHDIRSYPDRMPKCWGRKLCIPPEIIMVFWWAFVLSAVFVVCTALIIDSSPYAVLSSLLGAWIFSMGAVIPLFRYGRKLEEICLAEDSAVSPSTGVCG